MVAKAKRTPKHKVSGYHRCFVCGRPRAFMRRFQMSRLTFRELASQGMIPGVTKSSW